MNEQAIAWQAAARRLPPLTLYIHLPWCGKKCPYCDFNSHQAPARPPQQDYIDAVLADLEQALPLVWGRPLVAVFIGGGTPSLFSAAAVERLLERVRALFNLSPYTEVTLEANPDSSEVEKFAAFKAAGVNRLSLGVQSFDDRLLRRIGRLHDAAAAHAAAQAAVSLFEQVNIDLMHALPGQDMAQAVADVEQALHYQPAHLSLYQLTLEPGTPFFQRPPAGLPDEDAVADIGDGVRQRALAAGYRQYEVSAYAASAAQRCRHNLNYWQFGDYLGIGAGSHSKITVADKVLRQQRIKHWREYMRCAADNPIKSERQLSADERVFEFMLNALRLSDGFPTALMSEHVGGGTPLLWRALETAARRGLIEYGRDHIRPSAIGRRFLNDLTALFLQPPAVKSAKI